MITELYPGKNIPPHIYELAATHNVGMPIKRQGSSLVRIMGILGIMILAVVIVGIGQDVYQYLAFVRLSHLYPTIASIPDNQFSNYLQLSSFHDDFVQNLLQITAPMFAYLSQFFLVYTALRTKLYICSDGLLKIYKKKDEAARWDEIKEYYLKGSKVCRLVKADGDKIEFSPLLMNRSINALISKEVTDRLLPEALASYERGAVVKFGDVEVSQKGIYRPGKLTVSWRGELTPWDEIGEIKLKRGRFSVYQVKPELVGTVDSQLSTVYVGRWQVWQKHGDFLGPHESYWPNLPVFFVLLSMILAQRGETGVQEIQGFSQPLTLKEAAAIAARKNRSKKRVKILSITAAILLLISLPIAYFTYQASSPQQSTSTSTQPPAIFYAALAHKPYYAPVPGTNCDQGKAIWNEDDTNTYTCQKDGLLMTQKNFQYEDEIDFSFAPDSSSDYGNYIPHHYRVQVRATFVSGSVDTCVGIGVHLQSDAGRQEFDVCDSGSWSYYEEPLNSATETEADSGTLPTVKSSYLIAVDVTDTEQTLIVDNKTITTEPDDAYGSTYAIALVLSGNQIPLVPIIALFSNFRYTPYNN